MRRHHDSRKQRKEPNIYASRNIALCTKDCLCLFVCSTAATDTETGQFDRERCLDACPSHAIYLVMENYPKPKAKDPMVIEALEASFRILGEECARESGFMLPQSEAVDGLPENHTLR